MKFDYFLMTNDDVKTPSDIKDRTSGTKDKMPISMHKLTIVSPVAQKVWITFTTWDDDVVPSQCQGGYGPNENHYIVTPDGKWMAHDPLSGGPFQLDPIHMQANSYDNIEIHFNVGDKTNPTDWSVVAWGETGPVYVYHNGGKTTANWSTDPKHRKPASGKPATWDATKPSPRDKKLTKAPKAKKEVAARKAKWWVDPKDKFFKTIKNVPTSGSKISYTKGSDEPLELVKQSVKEDLPGYLAAGDDFIWHTINYGGGDRVVVVGNMSRDELNVWEIETT